MKNTKNKTNESTKSKKSTEVVLPTASYYTIKDLFAANPNVVPITLRVRVKKLVTDGTIVEIGTRHLAKGRPELVCVTAPVTQAVLDLATKDGVMLSEKSSVSVFKAPTTNGETVNQTSQDVEQTAAVTA